MIVCCLLIFCSGILITSFERSSGLDHKVMYVAENYLYENYGQKNWTITCGPGSRFEKTLVFASLEESTYYLIYYKGEIINRIHRCLNVKTMEEPLEKYL